MYWGASGLVLLTVVLSFSEQVVAKHSLRARNATKEGNATDDDTKMEDDGNVEVSWSPVVALVDKSLEATEAERCEVQEKLQILRKSCDAQEAACNQKLEETAAKLRRLTIAVAQLRQMRQNDAESVEENEKKKAVQEATVERDIADLEALQQFARLSKDDVDAQRKKYHELSVAYGSKVKDAEASIVKAHAKLDVAREKERVADGSAVSFTSDAMAISDGVNATDGFVAEEVMEAQRKEHSASALFKKAQGMATRAASMLRYHRARTASDEDEDDKMTKFEKIQSEEAEEAANAEEAEPCPPHHSESGESFIQNHRKPCIPAFQAKDDVIKEAEAAAQRARNAAIREASADDDSASKEDDALDSAEETD